jgi:hypothetical protein
VGPRGAHGSVGSNGSKVATQKPLTFYVGYIEYSILLTLLYRLKVATVATSLFLKAKRMIPTMLPGMLPHSPTLLPLRNLQKGSRWVPS